MRRNKEEIIDRHRQLLAEEITTGEPGYWYYSFADPNRPEGTQFLGAVIVRSPGFVAGLTAINMLSLNPGGEVQGLQVPPPNVIPDKWLNRLLSRDDIAEFDREMMAR